MRSKILFPLFLTATLGIIFLTTTSEQNGYYNNGVGCGGSGCHGSTLNLATTVAINGLPATFTPGTTYPLTFTVLNIVNPAAGFNMLASAGIFVAGSGSKINAAKNQITHTAPKSSVSNVTTFSFSWTAPAAGTNSVTFIGVGNAVDGTGGANMADQWNTTSATIGIFPNAVTDLNLISIICYPNPATEYIIAKGIGQDAKNISCTNICGQKFSPNYSMQAGDCKIDCSTFSSGLYILQAEVDGKILSSSFIKK